MSTDEWRRQYAPDGYVDLWVEEEFNAGSRVVVRLRARCVSLHALLPWRPVWLAPALGEARRCLWVARRARGSTKGHPQAEWGWRLSRGGGRRAGATRTRAPRRARAAARAPAPAARRATASRSSTATLTRRLRWTCRRTGACWLGVVFLDDSNKQSCGASLRKGGRGGRRGACAVKSVCSRAAHGGRHGCSTAHFLDSTLAVARRAAPAVRSAASRAAACGC